VVGEVSLNPGESIVSLSAGGGGYGLPLDRDPAAVLADVIDDYISVARAESVYGVVLSGDPARWETLTVDEPATAARRAELAASGALTYERDDDSRSEQEQPNWWVMR
jgi:N-methylhydantoinase B